MKARPVVVEARVHLGQEARAECVGARRVRAGVHVERPPRVRDVVLPDRVELPVLVVASASETGDAVGECVELPRDVPREDLDTVMASMSRMRALKCGDMMARLLTAPTAAWLCGVIQSLNKEEVLG